MLGQADDISALDVEEFSTSTCNLDQLRMILTVAMRLASPETPASSASAATLSVRVGHRSAFSDVASRYHSQFLSRTIFSCRDGLRTCFLEIDGYIRHG